MATKVFCDGCDKEICLSANISKVRVIFLARPVQEDGMTPDFDLCDQCLEHFRGNCLPTQWPRAATPSNP